MLWELRILVQVDGPGVEPDAAEALTTRGNRLDESIPGHGLGLSIVREIVQIHGGRVNFGRSQNIGGFLATVELSGHQEHPVRELFGVG